MKETIKKFDRTFERVGPNGGWLEHGAKLPDCSTAIIAGDAYVFAEAAKNMYGGEFRGGEFYGGAFYGGAFRGGVFRGGAFYGGVFYDGAFRGGAFSGGEFYDGAFSGGVFYDGVFYDGAFRGGVFRGGEFRGGEFYGGAFYGGAFRGGVFRGGEFYGGVFYDGAFRGGVFRGGAFRKSPSCAQRSDGYMFVAKVVDGKLRIWAGCRNFSWEEAVAHWNEDHPHGAESQRIIHFLKAQEEANA